MKFEELLEIMTIEDAEKIITSLSGRKMWIREFEVVLKELGYSDNSYI